MLKNGADYGAVFHFRAVAAGGESFGLYALADFAVVAAKGKFRSVGAAAHAMDGIGRDLRRVVHFAPQAGGFFPEFVVVCDGGYAGVAIFAI